MNRAVRSKYITEMRAERPVQSYLGAHLAWMRGENPEGAEALEDDLKEVFSSDEGLRVLKLLEKSVLFAGVPNGSSDGALREINAVRNFVLEIRRYVAHG